MSFPSDLFDTQGFVARWSCGQWTPLHGWVHILSDLAIFGAYAAIPVALVVFISRREDVPFNRLFWLFAGFILFCGVGHLIEASLFWWPWYRLSGRMKLSTAIISWVTVLALLPLIPKALAFPSLARMTGELQQEIAERNKAETLLHERVAELARANADLERFNQLSVGRERRMIELKREVNALLAQAGKPPAHDMSMFDQPGAS